MLEHLFGSKTRVKLLRIFFADPEKRFFVRELTRLLDVQINAIRRELQNLANSGIIIAITDETVEIPEDPHEGKRRYYRLNKSSVLFPELHALLLKSHVLGEQSLADQLVQAGEVTLLIFTGLFANTDVVPIDILIVGDIPERRVAKIIADFEHEHSTQLRYTHLTPREYHERRQLMDRFLYSVLDAPHQVAIDKTK